MADRRFHDAHEAFEAAWREASPALRPLHQGLVQVAAACHHVRRGRPGPARVLLARARGRLAPLAPAAGGARVDRLLADLDRLEAALESGEDPRWPTIHVEKVPAGP